MNKPELEIETHDPPGLGPCCICEGTENVRNVILLNVKGTIPGHGWGCMVCGLAADGASAVLCDACLDIYEKDNSALKFACRGYPAKEGRVPIDQLEGHHDHDMKKHKEYEISEASRGEAWNYHMLKK